MGGGTGGGGRVGGESEEGGKWERGKNRGRRGECMDNSQPHAVHHLRFDLMGAGQVVCIQCW